MNVTLPIPDKLAARLGEAGDLSRRVLEAFAADEYRAGRLSHPELRSLLGFATHAELDGFLNARGILKDYGQPDLDANGKPSIGSAYRRAGRRGGNHTGTTYCLMSTRKLS